MKSLDAQQAKALKLMKKSESIRLAIKKGRGKNLINSNVASSVCEIAESATRDKNMRNSTDDVHRRDSKLCLDMGMGNTFLGVGLLSHSKAREDHLDPVHDNHCNAEKENMIDEKVAGVPFHNHDEVSQSFLLGLNAPTKHLQEVSFEEMERCATANEMEELRGKYDGQV